MTQRLDLRRSRDSEAALTVGIPSCTIPRGHTVVVGSTRQYASELAQLSAAGGLGDLAQEAPATALGGLGGRTVKFGLPLAVACGALPLQSPVRPAQR